MDDHSAPPEAPRLPLRGPHCPGNFGPLPPGFFSLRLTMQPDGAVLELTRPDMLLGRHTGSDVRLPLPDVSRRHCQFVFEDGHWHVLDLKSLNGVFVNGERVVRCLLRHGDEVRIGGFTFVADLETGMKAAAAPATSPPKSTNVLQSIADALPTLTPGSGHRKAA